MNKDIPTRKVGIFAYSIDSDDAANPYILLYRPKPKRDLHKRLMLQLARGTVEAGELLIEAAYREAEEELGITRDMMVEELHAVGEMPYSSSPTQKPYAIQWFIAALHEPYQGLTPQDAAEVRWVKARDVEALAMGNRFKKSYMGIVEALLKRL